MSSNDTAKVIIAGNIVGALSFDRDTGIALFEYDPVWRAQGLDLFPLHMPRSTEIYSFPYLNTETYKGLPPGLADTLPDDFGNAVIDQWLARQGRDVASFSPVERLLYTGSRGMGALEYVPQINGNTIEPKDIEISRLVTVAQDIINIRSGNSSPSELSDSEDASDLFQVGTSAGGARAKAVIAMNADYSSVCAGHVHAPDGYEHYLIKFDGISEKDQAMETHADPKGYGRMEYAYYLMSRDAGIHMMDCDLLEHAGLAHFITKRFDRVDGEKRHFQSLCAMDHADYKKPGAYSYEQLFAVMRKLNLTRQEQIEMYRRMVFNVVARNQDDHTKNTGFLMTREGEWTLSPAYDVAYSYKKGSEWVNDHQMTINGKRNDFIRADLLSVASQIGRFDKQANTIVNEVIDVVSQWSVYAERAKVFENFIQEINKNLRLKL